MRIFNQATGCWEQLVDLTNMHIHIPNIISLLRAENRPTNLVGFDIETEDSQRHPGLNQFMAIDAESEEFKKSKKLVFDLRRTNITGFSLQLDGLDTTYYFNFFHADVENRIPKEIGIELLQIVKDTSLFVIHNAAFEIAQCLASWGFDIGPNNYICTMQLCVSAYNDDEYDINKFAAADLGGIKVVIPEIERNFAGYQPKTPLSTQQREVLQKVAGKNSDSQFSYNGYVRALAYGYGLKKAVKSWFGYSQTDFKDVLNGKAHMGLLTAAEVLHYGADDAYWCLTLLKRVTQFIQETNPPLLEVFYRQENPMPYIWADCWVRGLRLNYKAIQFRKDEARNNYAMVIRELIKALRHFKFTDYPCPRMVEKQEKWYIGVKKDKKAGTSEPANKFLQYRERWMNIINLDIDNLSDFDLVSQLSGSVTSNWIAEVRGEQPKEAKGKGKKAKADPTPEAMNITHYMAARVLYHDLMDISLVFVKGAVQSGAEARGKLREFIEEMTSGTTRWLKELNRYKQMPVPEGMTKEQYAKVLKENYPKEAALTVLNCLDKLANIEQTMKLYLNPYLMLVDPETHRVYPVISSRLNTRRMSSENPNTMQMAKKGESTFVRGFFLPDDDDHVYVSVDWSQVELVLIGEESKDPGFHAAYGQIPYNDLHLGAAAAAVQVYHSAFTAVDLKNFRIDNVEVVADLQEKFPKAFINPVKQIPMEGKTAYKFWRGEAGKTSNFGYWYSGSLMTVQGKLNWTMDEMWTATDNYRSKFPVAENWRVNTIEEVKGFGFVHIFDGHRRVRFEGTSLWRQLMLSKFSAYGSPALTAFGELLCNAVGRRSGNQAVNAKIQGGCATLAKRSIKRLWDIIRNEGLNARFTIPIHDELVFSVHKDLAVDFGYRIRDVMCNHPDLVQWLKLDGTISIGGTLEPYHPKKAPLGQIELDEAPVIEGYIPAEYEGKALTRELRQKVVEYLFSRDI